MSEPARSYRYERKFLVPPSARHRVEPSIKLNPCFFWPLYQARTVNNIYLDSPAQRLYFLNLEGAANRVKVRLRWYGDLAGFILKPVLEFKIKRGLLGTKESYPLKPFALDTTFSPSTLRRVLLESDLPAPVRCRLDGLEPALLNSYRRSYYQSADRRFRLTWDATLEFFRLGLGPIQLLGRAAHCPFQVLELKYDAAHAADAAEVAGHLPFRVTRISKYVFGVDSFDGY